MNYFGCCFLKKALFLICLNLFLIAGGKAGAEQRDEEMQVLLMFYREKDLVVSPTRFPKPISQVAENIAVVTAAEIEAMNAHTVAEVLNRVAGVFVNFNQDFGAPSLISIQASEARHVLVLVDGVPWNFISEGSAETNSIPVGIIDRIEIIKGPASSAWGSSLGGVISILTKPVGNDSRPEGKVRASFGRDNTRDYRAELAGRTDALGYFLFAGYQDSGELRNSRKFDRPAFYAKLNLALPDNADMGLSIGYSQPDIQLGDFESQDITSSADVHSLFTNASLKASITENLSVDTSFYCSSQKFAQQNDALGLGIIGPAGDLFLKTAFDEQTLGGNGKLVWESARHTAVLGAEYARGRLDQRLDAGSLLQFFGAPAATSSSQGIDRWAVFANDTVVVDRFALTPGIRYDHNDISGPFISPSLGATYRLGENSILRASVARGFTIPPLAITSGGALFLDPNPDIEPEEVWSYQAGAETAAIPYLWLKATLFYHDLNDRLERELFGAGPPTFNDLVINSGSIKRQGIELELQTAPIHHLSLRGNFAYTDLSPVNEAGSDRIWACNLGLQYDDEKSLTAGLFGHYIQWGFDPVFEASDDDIIWDFNLGKRFDLKHGTAATLFFSVHNILNGDQFTRGDDDNPRRWAEAGLRFAF